MPDSPSASAKGYTLVLLAATLWGTMGVFYKILIERYQMTPLVVASMRSLWGGLILCAAIVLLKRSLLRIHLRDLPLLMAYGVIGVAGFFVAYAYAVALTGVAVAAVLLYTAPAWVGLMAWRWLGESMHRRVVVALLMTLAGSVLVAGLYDLASLQVNALGIVAGLGAGLGYALWSVFNKIAVQRYSAWTVQVYALLIGAATLLVVVPTAQRASPQELIAAWPWLLAMALGPTLGGALSYTLGVRWIPVSIASIVATLEPVIAMGLAFVLFDERLTVPQLVGSGLIIGAVVLLRPRDRH